MSLSRKSLTAVFGSLLLVAIGGCCSYKAVYNTRSVNRPPGAGPDWGNVDEITLTAYVQSDGSVKVGKETVEINARKSSGGRTPVAGQIHWKANKTDKSIDLHVDADTEKASENPNKVETACLDSVSCQGPDCTADANAGYKGENGKPSANCKYRIWIGKNRPADPVIIVDNCCP